MFRKKSEKGGKKTWETLGNIHGRRQSAIKKVRARNSDFVNKKSRTPQSQEAGSKGKEPPASLPKGEQRNLEVYS